MKDNGTESIVLLKRKRGILLASILDLTASLQRDAARRTITGMETKVI